MNTDKITNLLDQETIKYLFSIFHNYKSEIRLVGGSIRDTLIDRDVKDIDSATPLEPDEVLDLLKKHNIEYDDYALRYGSIIAYLNNKKIQITTLREDINQLGRHTSVLFTKDWKKDAARRDFTFNALYLGIDQTVYDFYNGQKDLKEKKIKFIGEIEERIKEDYSFSLVWGELGPIYGKQWRDWDGVDQIASLLENIKANPNSNTMKCLIK